VAAAGDGSALSPATAVITYLAFINGLLAVFNLIPAFPLDGGRMLRSALWGWKGDILWATRIAGAIGMAFGFGLILLGLLSAITGNFVTGIWWFLLGMFLQMAARASVEQSVMRSRLSGVPVSRLMRRDPLSVSPDLSIEHLVQDYFYTHFFKWFPVATADGRLVGVVDIHDLKKVDKAEWSSRNVRDVMEPCSDDNSIAETSDAARALQQMQRTGKSRFLVVENGKLRGVLALRDLINFLSMTAELPA
jgi:CBS domain-containing protein